MPDHVHMLLSIPPKYAVSQVVGYIKGKSAIHLASLWRAEARLCRSKFLGTRIFRLDRRSGRNRHQGLHQETGNRRPEVGTIELVALARLIQPAGRRAKKEQFRRDDSVLLPPRGRASPRRRFASVWARACLLVEWEKFADWGRHAPPVT